MSDKTHQGHGTRDYQIIVSPSIDRPQSQTTKATTQGRPYRLLPREVLPSLPHRPHELRKQVIERGPGVVREAGVDRRRLNCGEDRSSLPYGLRKPYNSFGEKRDVISRYRDKRTERFANRQHVPAFSGFAKKAAIKLRVVESARSLSTLSNLPGNRHEALKGDRVGQYSIRINDQWRLCFEWSDEASMAVNIEIVDYH